MSRIPASVDFLSSASSSAAKARSAVPVAQTADSLDVAIALKCLGSYQLERTQLELEQLDNEENAAPLIAAARTLQSVAEHLSKTGSPENSTELMLFAAIGHAMYGNFPSAKAALQTVPNEYLGASPVRYIAAIVCLPNGPQATQRYDDNKVEIFRKNWFSALREFSAQSRHAYLQQSEIAFRELAVEATETLDRALSLNVLMAMRQAYRLSIAQLYESAPEIPIWFVQNSIQSGLVTLLPPQRELLLARKVAAGGANTLLTLPTSTGKTFIAEACMAAASESGGISIYIAPYVAIGEQVRASLLSKVGNEIQLISMFGGFKFESLSGTGGRALLIMTPERFDAWLRNGEYLPNLRLVIFDEMHIVENGTRGARVEGLISRLLLLQRRFQSLRIMGLSAVLAEADRVCQWMRVSNDNLHRISWRPTARRVAVCLANGRMHWVHGNDALRPPNLFPNSPISAPVDVRLPERVAPAINPATYEVTASHNVAALTLNLRARLGGPALVVCRRRADTRFLAVSLSNELPLLSNDALIPIAEKIRTNYPWLDTLANCMLHGIAYHNASLPFDVRRDIEAATRARYLSVVCSTTTLAEGADLPFRWTLISHWLASDGHALKSMTFRNIAGRSGRAGAFTEGDTILFANNGGPKDSYRGVNIESTLNSVMFSSSPIKSTAGLEFINFDDVEQGAIESTFSAQLLAAIKENEEAEDIVSLFGAASYATQDHSTILHSILSNALVGLLDQNLPGGAMAVMNSPVRLTPFGVAANTSGFSPDSSRRMAQYLMTYPGYNSATDLYSDLLWKFFDLQEQQNFLWKKIVGEPNQRHPFKKEDLHAVLEKLWLKQDIRSIFDELPARARSRAGPNNVDKQFDGFVSFVDAVVRVFLPWLLRGMSSLSAFGNDTCKTANWIPLANFLEDSPATQAEETDNNFD